MDDFLRLYPRLVKYIPNWLERFYPRMAQFAKGGYPCGNQGVFIPANKKCWKHPKTGQTLKKPLTYQMYQEAKVKSQRSRTEKGRTALDDREQRLKQLGRERTKIKPINIPKATELTIREQEEIFTNWNKSIEKHLNSDTLIPSKKGVVKDIRVVLGMLEDNYKYQPDIITKGIKSSTGKIQSFYSINDRMSKTKGALYLDVLATNPDNIVDEVRGAGKSAIYNVIQDSKASGYKGAVYLDALPRAIPFYEAVGFKQVGGSKTSLHLTQEAAELFAQKFQRIAKIALT